MPDFDSDDVLAPSRGVIVGVLAGLLLWTIFIATVVAVLAYVPPSGPNCPGMDPQWLGTCE